MRMLAALLALVALGCATAKTPNAYGAYLEAISALLRDVAMK
jgi:hypothetical protein